MPELPEVETVVRGLSARMAGRRVTRLDLHRGDLRWPIPKDLKRKTVGRRIEAVRRRAKYILIDLDDGGVLLLHLGMSGRLTLVNADDQTPPEPHDHVVFTLDDGTRIRFNDQRRFGVLDYVRAKGLEKHSLLRELGPEPLDPAFTGEVLAASLTGKRTPLKAALLDQQVVAGLGNIYVSEVLYRAGLSPRRLARTVTLERARRLVQAIREVLERAIAAGGSSLRNYVQASGELGYFQHQWAVYGREGEPCPGCDCGGGIRRIVQSNRSTFYCVKRQR
ncbi:MAG TPA: bifunctional DNA-formamidopyrimidine glycosylase/DNA-(apurinic or apyrimidinic site) lyase [Stellaceae bacterium]|nr:bifunctional DNA-formamidopyrimidine glycosylase/DNA-(apurinic or apyrimidinic site) lyase [Stellaceae bacterium]